MRAKIECNIIFSSISSLPESSEVSESVHNSERLGIVAFFYYEGKINSQGVIWTSDL